MIRENEIFISVIRDLLFFLFVNRARDPPCTTLINEKFPSDQITVYNIIMFTEGVCMWGGGGGGG